MAKIKKNVTMADIAAKLNVSVVTVSKALSGQKGVSEEVRVKIERLAEELGYQPPAQSGNLSTQKDYHIGVLISTRYLSDFNTSFYWKMYQEVSEYGIPKRCYPVFESITDVMEDQKILPRMLTENTVDAVLVIGKPGYEYADFLKFRVNIPMVFMDFYGTDLEVDSVVSDGYYGAYALTQYLISKGHRKIAFVGTLLATESITDRYLGYTKALLENKIAVRPEYLIPDRDAESGLREEEYQFIYPENMPTAFVCNCDLTASVLINNLRERGFKVPGDISVVGYDNYLSAVNCDIGITTYAVDMREMARRSIKLLIKRINGDTGRKNCHIVQGYLIEKDSVSICENVDRELLFLDPVLKENIWGGRRLIDEFPYQSDGASIGECWGISAHENGDCKISEGKYKGYSLSKLYREHKELFGNISDDKFPLLVKIIDAKDKLSIQVHPDDTYANRWENGSLGKNECWYIMDCPEHAELVVGHNAKTKEELISYIEKGKYEELIKHVPVRKGDMITIKPGTVHSITEGVMLLETQQSSDITYRVYDYNRLVNGKPRPLHLKQCVDVITVPDDGNENMVFHTDNILPDRLCLMSECEYYKVWKLNVVKGIVFEQKYPFLLVSVIAGKGRICGNEVQKGTHLIVPSDFGKVTFAGEMELILSTVHKN